MIEMMKNQLVKNEKPKGRPARKAGDTRAKVVNRSRSKQKAPTVEVKEEKAESGEESAEKPANEDDANEDRKEKEEGMSRANDANDPAKEVKSVETDKEKNEEAVDEAKSAEREEAEENDKSEEAKVWSNEDADAETEKPAQCSETEKLDKGSEVGNDEAIEQVEVGDTKSLDEGAIVGSQSQPLILPSEDVSKADDISVPDPERTRKGTALGLIGEPSNSASLESASSLQDPETSSKEEKTITEQLISSSYIDTNLSVPNILTVDSFKSPESDPTYAWEPYNVHTTAKIEVPAEFTEKAAPYVKQVIEPSLTSYRTEAKLFIVHEEEEPRRFQKNVADCMGAPEQIKVDGLFESLLTYEENLTTTDAEPVQRNEARPATEQEPAENEIDKQDNAAENEADEANQEGQSASKSLDRSKTGNSSRSQHRNAASSHSQRPPDSSPAGSKQKSDSMPDGPRQKSDSSRSRSGSR